MGMDAKEEDDEELNKGNVVISQVNDHLNVFWVIQLWHSVLQQLVLTM